MSELSRSLAALAFVCLAGCATVPQEAAPPPVEPPPAVPSEAPALPPPAPAPVAPAPRPLPVRKDVAVLFDAGAHSQTAIVDAIGAALPPQRYRVEPTALAAGAEPPTLPHPPAVIVAVGARAVERARALYPGTPIVFCQVFAAEELLAAGGPIWGVAAVPPLELQLETWRTVDPGLRNVALILSEGHLRLAEEAVRAAESVAATVRLETSASDRETLYLFKRLAADVDGLWLLPDDRVLSPDVLRELLGYAASHGVGVLAPSGALLDWGALASVSTVAEDVAATVGHVVERVASGRTQGLAAVTPLSAVEVQVNQSVASMLGLAALPRSRWVTREPD